ncbi:hypothetical protein BJ165DRAFT_1506979 [Panaeolus papilionaceus]|nr:hypothetical protein BJ165DRAFT_1506979 [Panaeolus papilionaceus]
MATFPLPPHLTKLILGGSVGNLLCGSTFGVATIFICHIIFCSAGSTRIASRMTVRSVSDRMGQLVMVFVFRKTLVLTDSQLRKLDASGNLTNQTCLALVRASNRRFVEVNAYICEYITGVRALFTLSGRGFASALVSIHTNLGPISQISWHFRIGRD